MDDEVVGGFPRSWGALTAETTAIGFTMASDTRAAGLMLAVRR